MSDIDEARRRLEAVFRGEHARVVGALMRRFGDLDVAQDAAAEAYEVALRRWPRDGVPPNPGAWLTTTATRKALDRLRRESGRAPKEEEAYGMIAADQQPLGAVDDDRLRLLFLCCHPALAFENRVALTLRFVAGLSTVQIARAFLVPDRTMAQRITRAKRKIRDARIPFRVPGRDDLPERLSGVLAVLYLVFNEAYLSSEGPDSAGEDAARRDQDEDAARRDQDEDAAPAGTEVGEPGVRDDLAAEAIRLTRLLVELMPAEPEAQGLLALMLLTHARRRARIVAGALVPLDEQDRRRWDVDLIAEGHVMVRALLAIGSPGPYQVQAAIAAVHTDTVGPGGSARDVDWAQVVALYDLLLTLAPSPVAALNRAIALSHVEGPDAALRIVDGLDLPAYHPWHVARSDLLQRSGKPVAAREALDRALALATNPLERAHLLGRRRDLSGP